MAREIQIPSGVYSYYARLTDLDGALLRLRIGNATGTSASVVYDVNYCGRYAVYYTGAKGGWGSFLFEGNCKRKDQVERHSINKSYSNVDPDFGEKPYISEIVPEYELNTGWLTDKQSELFVRDLMQSNQLYLHDLDTNKLFPVVITDSETTYKKFADEHKLISYKLNVKESQTKLRK